MSSTASRTVVAVVLAAGVLAAAPAVWWLAGLLPDEDLDGASPDFAITPPAIGATAELVIGLVAVAVLACAAVALDRSTRVGLLAPGWARIVAAAALAAGYVGLTFRVGTEPVIGVNIGYGMLMLGAIPVLVGLGVWAVQGFRSLDR